MRKRHLNLAFAGSIHFVTTVTRVRGSWFTKPEICEEILSLFEGYRSKHDVDCYGYVLMPDHLHALLVQQAEGAAIPLLMEGFKSVSSRRIHPAGYPQTHLWSDRYDDVPVPGAEAARTKLEYMLANPVRRSLAERPEMYPWSSARDHFGMGKGIVTVTPL